MPGRISLIRRVFGWIYYLPLQGKEISPARESFEVR